MKITLKSAHGYLCAIPPAPHADGTPNPEGEVRWEYRAKAGPWESFELDGFEIAPVVPVVPVVPPPPIVKPPDPGKGCDRFAVPGAEAFLVACWCEEIQPRGSVQRALDVTARVAWALRKAGAGLSAKPSGENIADYHGTSVSVSRVMFRDGRLFKILTDVPTTNGATWDANGTLPLDRWVAPIDPADPTSSFKK